MRARRAAVALGVLDGRLRFVPATHDDPLARPLLAELAVEYAQRYGGTNRSRPSAGGLDSGVIYTLKRGSR
ncbi:hypothetical protein JHV675_51760 [Mycobacterium avium subsp. hominissuis]